MNEELKEVHAQLSAASMRLRELHIELAELVAKLTDRINSEVLSQPKEPKHIEDNSVVDGI